MRRKMTILVVSAAMYFPCCGQNILNTIIRKDSLYDKYKEIFKHPTKYHLQVIYTQVNRDKNKKITLKKYLQIRTYSSILGKNYLI